MDIIIKLLPTLVLVGLGYSLKRLRVFDANFGRALLKFVFLVAAPALALRSISQLHLDSSLLALIILPIVLTAASPVGFNAITFSSIEKLDDEFATSIVSVGLITGLILISALTVFLS